MRAAPLQNSMAHQGSFRWRRARKSLFW